MASSVKVATVKTTPNRPSTAKVMACASLATKTAALDASLSRLHSTPTEETKSYLFTEKVILNRTSLHKLRSPTTLSHLYHF